MAYKSPEKKKESMKKWRDKNPDYSKSYWKKHKVKYKKVKAMCLSDGDVL